MFIEIESDDATATSDYVPLLPKRMVSILLAMRPMGSTWANKSILNLICVYIHFTFYYQYLSLDLRLHSVSLKVLNYIIHLVFQYHVYHTTLI